MTEAMKIQVYRDYAAKKVKNKCCEVDHLISRELGGADDLKNLWPQPWPEARKKDRLENRLHKLICTGNLKLEWVQKEIARNWVLVYREIFGELPW